MKISLKFSQLLAGLSPERSRGMEGKEIAKTQRNIGDLEEKKDF